MQRTPREAARRRVMEVRGGDWVVASIKVWAVSRSWAVTETVGEMVEFAASGGSFVGLLLTEMRPISSFDEAVQPVYCCLL